MRTLLLAVTASLLLAVPASAAPTWLPPTNFELGGTGGTDFPDADAAVSPTGIAVAAWVASVGVDQRMRVSVRFPGQGFGPVTTLTPSDGSDALAPSVAFDGSGNATVAWQETQGPGGLPAIRAALIPAGSPGPAAPQTVSDPSLGSIAPALGVGAGGSAVIAYSENQMTQRRVRAVVRSGPADAFGAPTTLSNDFTAAETNTDVAVDADGDAVVVWQQLVGGFTVIESSARPAGGPFNPPATGVQTISNSVLNSSNPSIAMAPAGTAVVLWQQNTAPLIVAYNERNPSGQWLMEPKPASTGQANQPDVGIDGAGNAIGVWRATSGTASFLQAGVRPAGGAFGGAVRDLTSTDIANPQIAMNFAGDAVITFGDAMAQFIGSVQRARNGAFSGVIPVEQQATAGTALFNGGLGVDDEGNATAAWTRNINPGNTWDVAAAAFDAAPPTLTSSVPAGGVEGSPIGMAAAAADRLTPVTITWAFGDGGTASGGAVSHAFGAPGAFTVTVAAADAVGNVATESHPVLISPPQRKGKPRVRAKLGITWGVAGKKIYLLRLKASKVPKGGKLELRCKGKKCPYKRISSKKRKKGTITLFPAIKPSKVVGKTKRSFRAGQTLEVRITAPRRIGKVARYKLKAGRIPVAKDLCLPIGKKTPRKRCS